MRTRYLWTTLFALTVVGARQAAAQQDPRLVAVVRLAQDGMGDSARAVIGRILTATAPTDSLFPEALYTSALVAATEADRRLALRRIIFEYSQSPWADDAIFLLGQLEYAGNDPAAAMRQMGRLIGDYPTSPLLPQAAFWGARAASDARQPAQACTWAELGLKSVGINVELQNLLEFQKQRCTALLAARPETTPQVAAAPADTGKPTAKPAPPKNKGPVYRVQVAAAQTQAQADRAVAAVKKAGYDAVVVKEGGYLKVRAGAFTTAAEAAAALAKIRAHTGGKPFVVHDR
jgi:hypothetical protein